jgi:hypothetical protein
VSPPVPVVPGDGGYGEAWAACTITVAVEAGTSAAGRASAATTAGTRQGTLVRVTGSALAGITSITGTTAKTVP